MGTTLEGISTQQQLYTRIDLLLRQQRNVHYLPQTIFEIQKTVADKDSNARQLAQVILEDPALTARILRLANSVYFNKVGRKVKTVTDAIVMLGFEAIRNIALGLSIFQLVTNLRGAHLFRDIWRHSICCAVFCRELAHHEPDVAPEEAFVAGLLHDIGKLILGQFFPDDYEKCLTSIENQTWEDHLMAEKHFFHATHLDVGLHIADKWSFPPSLKDVIQFHEVNLPTDTWPEDYPSLLKVVSFSNAISRVVERPVTARTQLTQLGELAKTTWRIDNNTFDKMVFGLGTKVNELSRILDILVEDTGSFSLPGVEEDHGPCEEHKKENDKAKLDFCLSLTDLVNQGLGLREFMKITITEISNLLSLHSMYLMFHNKKANLLQTKYGSGPSARQVQKDMEVPLNLESHPISIVFNQKQTLNLTLDNLPDFCQLGRYNLFEWVRTHNICIVPLLMGRDAIGVIVACREPKQPGLKDEDMRLLNLYAQQLVWLVEKKLEA